MIWLGKRRWRMILLVVIAVGGVCLALPEQRAAVPAESIAVSADCVAETNRYDALRMERDDNRSLARELLQAAIDRSAEEGDRREKEKELWELDKDCQTEAEVELILKARGYGDVLAFCRKDNVCVVLQTAKLDREEVAEIAPLIASIAKVRQEQIVIRAKP